MRHTVRHHVKQARRCKSAVHKMALTCALSVLSRWGCRRCEHNRRHLLNNRRHLLKDTNTQDGCQALDPTGEQP